MILGKVIILGDSGVGKTSIQRSYINSQFEKTEQITIGVDYNSTIIKIENEKVKLSIWDTAGQEVFRSVSRSYYSGADIAVIVFDVRYDASNKIEYWIEEILSHRPNLPIVLVGNKCDLMKDDIFPQKYNNYEYPIFFVSAKCKMNLNMLFEHIAEIVYKTKCRNENKNTIEIKTSSFRKAFTLCWP